MLSDITRSSGAWAINFRHALKTRRHPLVTATLLVVSLCLLPTQESKALTSEEMFADGNRLSRDELYWAALLRYEQAKEAGLSTAVLYYNIGVTHYRAGQHKRAREALLTAAQSPRLRVITHFNLGLNEYAAGDVDKALEWFYMARDQSENREIRKLARTAISRLEKKQEEIEIELVPKAKIEAERKHTAFDLSAYVGYGSNDNVYRAPSETYQDLADPTTPIVTPEIFSGGFIPFDVRVKYSINSYLLESFYAAYRITGRLYQDEEIENADEYSHELSFGSSYVKETEDRSRRVFSAFTVAQHEETYFDPDDGSEREVNNVLIGDRLSYKRYGPEFAWVQAFRKFALGLRVKGQLWNYDNTSAAPEYDHEYFVFGAHAQYSFTETALVRLTVDKYSRRYSDRPSFDLNGDQLVTAPDARYDYLAIGASARQRITSRMWFGFNLERTERTDQYVGYNDYTRDEFGFDFRWTPTNRLSLELATSYRNYDYPNAFAFHNPAGGIKSLEVIRGNLAGEFRITQRLSVNIEADYRDSSSSDTRINYDRTWFTLGFTWRQ